MIQTKKRERFELIVDTNLFGRRTLKGCTLLLNYIEKEKRDIYEETRVIIPLQIDIEGRSRLFTEFLEKELSREDDVGYLEEFYKENISRIKFVETDVSRAYKARFCIKAIEIVNQEKTLTDIIFSDVLRIAKKYYPERNDINEPLLQEYFQKFVKDVFKIKRSSERRIKRSLMEINSFIDVQNIKNGLIIKNLRENVMLISLARVSKNLFSKN